MKLSSWLLAAALALGAGCGPSSKQVQVATAAQYQASLGRMYELALDVASDKYKIFEQDPEHARFLTLPIWYTPEGTTESGGSGDTVMIRDGSMLLALLVEVTPVAGRPDAVAVHITPVVERHRLGQSMNDKLPPDDPSMPGWVAGRVEALSVAIYDRAKNLAVTP
jgi:hypothetical protein